MEGLEGGADFLADERKKTQFDVDAMKILWAGGKREFEIADRIARLVASDPAFKKDHRAILFKNTARKAAYAWKRIIELRVTEEEASQLRFFVDEPAFTDLHWVTREGKVVQSSIPRQLIYGTMVFVRQAIVYDASRALSKAVCIATRYSAVRRQFGNQNGREIQVIDYKTQQSLKSLSASVTADGIEECRKLCGGHGYLCSSGLPELFAVYVPACTYEGDNVVLLWQVARILMKTVAQLGSSKQPVGTMSYMGRAEHLMQCCCSVHNAEDWSNPSVIMEAFEARSLRMSVACAKSLSKYSNIEEGFLELSADLAGAAVAHCQLIVVSKFIEKLQREIPGNGVKQQLRVCGIYALSNLKKHLGDFLSTGCITPKQASHANDLLRSLFSQIRPNAIALVDAFNYTDQFLGSVFGRYDGNVYPKLYEEAWKDPLNETVVPDGYREYIQPMLKQQLWTSRL